MIRNNKAMRRPESPWDIPDLRWQINTDLQAKSGPRLQYTRNIVSESRLNIGIDYKHNSL